MYLQELQDYQAKGRITRHLHGSAAQTAPGLIENQTFQA